MGCQHLLSTYQVGCQHLLSTYLEFEVHLHKPVNENGSHPVVDVRLQDAHSCKLQKMNVTDVMCRALMDQPASSSLRAEVFTLSTTPCVSDAGQQL